MQSRRRICVVTGSRAEYGLLYWVLHDLHGQPEVELQLVVTGMHLSHEFGLTVREIESDPWPITRRVDMLVAGDSASATAKSIGLGVIGFAEVFEQLRPDIVVVLGDRFEILAAAQGALVQNVFLAHICGGDTTEGAFDEAMRHAITKMAHLHFVTNELSARRVRQLGEDPGSVHVVGNPGLDHLRRGPRLSREELAHSLGAPLGKRNALVTFHPVTLEPDSGARQLNELLAALNSLPNDFFVWCTRANADTGGRELNRRVDAWAAGRANVRVYSSLGQQRYLGLMAQVDVVVGNSSSGLYEAPSFCVPTVNVGDRQRGRLAAASVIHCEPRRSDIAAALNTALKLDCSSVINPYGDGYSAQRIVAQLLAQPLAGGAPKKHFHLIGEPTP